MEDKPNQKGEFSSDAEKLLHYLLTSHYLGGRHSRATNRKIALESNEKII